MAPPNPKVIAAFRAMTNLGIHESKVKPVLKKLIKLYEGNWELIEEENYRALVDAIFEEEDNQEGGIEAEAPAPVQQVRPLKRLRLRGQDGQILRLPTSGDSPSLVVSPVKSRLPTSGGSPSSPGSPLKSRLPTSGGSPRSPAASPLKSRGSPSSPSSSPLTSPKPRPGTVPESGSELQPQSPSVLSRRNALADKGKKPISPLDTSRRRKSISDRSPSKERAVEPGTSPSPKTKTPHPYPFITPKEEPVDEEADYEVPISMVFPEPLTAGEQDDNNAMASQCRNENTEDEASVASQVPVSLPSPSDPDDITKGEEKVKIPWVNNSTNDKPPLFHYMPQNTVFQDAYVNISLSRIGNKDCCSTCMGNCVLSSKPCSCANKTGGDFAYTAQGVVKEEFLDECIANSRTQSFTYCKECPLETSKNDGCLEPCKGHLKRKFIKECWSKCGCGKHCGNRIVQRGITCNLQVFLTSDGKGWGLRTLEELPKGAFVCEFVGEILTVRELHERNKARKYTLPILLDVEWGSGVVKDNQALCLYAASYGNAARFINHRCLDANLIEIPVEIESPSHHYYHFAFFTSREIKAQEELTWDYGIDFDGDDQSLELFKCKCGSRFCRNMKRTNRTVRSFAAA
ncbi:histone-lysine N-methyltransferase SUVR4-like [Vicia villosa]|uniref:histone-lysine N-methyltransferase SUVR4-like n=1 Tax=Vicia villosa TaxID=3911 RepID=UPI00273B5FA0|nr:histone-lysine N-methyltransferase SUVR4-like [Vicia villosa]XP_058767005.1 histone-lysine N-methyltransferase SUVR4-like [Vicia villosa]